MLKAISLLILGAVVLVSYQNCAVYQSEGREQLEDIFSGLSHNCLPYLDINIASQVVGHTNITLTPTTNGCTITDRTSYGNDRYEYKCTYGQNIKHQRVDPLNVPGIGYVAHYRAPSYCQSNGGFNCEDPNATAIGSCDQNPPGANARHCLATNLIASGNTSLEPKVALLAFFERAAPTGYAYAEYFDNNVQIHYLAANNTTGVHCSTSVVRQVPINEINSLNARRVDYDEIWQNNSASSDINVLERLTYEILHRAN